MKVITLLGMLAWASAEQLVNLVEVKQPEQEEACETTAPSDKFISGFFANWKPPATPGAGAAADASYYKNDFYGTTHVFYSFLSLASTPDPNHPPQEYWSGEAIYDTLTRYDVAYVLTHPDDYNYNWSRVKMVAQMEAQKDRMAKFIWSIGGYSDLTKGVQEKDVGKFVQKCVELLQIGGDGIDFQWLHMSEDHNATLPRREVQAEVIYQLRLALDDAGMTDKEIGYTGRYNECWDILTRPKGFLEDHNEGTVYDMNFFLNRTYGVALKDQINWVNLMMYDMPPTSTGANGTLGLDQYMAVFNACSTFFNGNQIVMGFEPGGQPAGGEWEGMDTDKEVVEYIQKNDLGGIMLWAINQTPSFGSSEPTGKNAQDLASFASNEFRTPHCPNKQPSSDTDTWEVLQ